MTCVTMHQKYLTTVKAKTLCNALINSKFYYASLISMLARKLLISKRTKQNKKKKHFRPLQVVHNKYDTTYDELLSINNDVSIYQRHLRFLVPEVFKSVNKLNPHFMWDYFNMKIFSYDLRKGNILHTAMK